MARLRCVRCERPQSSCLCDLLRAHLPQPIDNAVELLLLQHPAEAGHAKGTATLLQLGLRRVTLRRGERAEPPEDERMHVLVYPGLAAGTCPVAAPPSAGLRLVLLDGSWRQSRALLRESAWLQGLPRLALRAAAPSRYALRRAHAPGQLSTLEAAVQALRQIDADSGAPDPYPPLLAAFDAFVAEGLRRAGR